MIYYYYTIFKRGVSMLNLKAHAKINWTLDITGRREDGYHLMDMLMQSVSVYDELSMETADTLILEGVTDEAAAQQGSLRSESVTFDESNIVFKAARLLQEKTGYSSGARIKLRKNIPSGAGMGGGSADAAAALVGLNQLWGLGLSQDELDAAGLRLGADVPFLLHGGFCRVRGIGEILEPLVKAPELSLVICKPCAGLSTKAVFAAYDQAEAPLLRPDQAEAAKALAAGDLHGFSRSSGNVLQAVSEDAFPQIGLAIRQLKEDGALFAAMTGSGSAVFGVFEDLYSSALAVRNLKAGFSQDPAFWVSWAKTLSSPKFF